MAIISKNPFNQEVNQTFNSLSKEELATKLENAQNAFEVWKKIDIKARAEVFMSLAKHLRENKNEFAEIITREMGKPITMAVAEIEKCAWNCEYFSENAEKLLQPEQIETEFKESYLRFDPLGVILFVMPWNFPFWQVLRQAVPTIIAGNTVVLKHASNVPMSAIKIEEIFKEVGFPEGVFQTLLIESSQVESVLSDFRVRGVSLTGSEGAGSSVASIAGKHIKKSVMELGGNDPFIIFEDADLAKTVAACSQARLNNTGQVCNSPKRVIVMEQVAEQFIELLKVDYESKKIGDPMNPETQVGPLAMEKILTDVERQVKKSIDVGATLVTGGERLEGEGNFYKPTILILNKETEAFDLQKTDMPAYHEEIFGPVSSVIIVKTRDEAIKIANDSKYGLAASIWTKDVEGAKDYLAQVDAGSVYINKNVSSDPRLTIGGIKNSGFGRELSPYGLKEFVNIKSVVIED